MLKLISLAGSTALALAACGEEKADVPVGNAAGALESQSFAAIDKREDLSAASRLLKAAGLERPMQVGGSYTVFTLTDQAFAALPQEQRAMLDSPQGRPQLMKMVRHHMASGYLTIADVRKTASHTGMELSSLGAAPISIRMEGDTIFLGEGANAARIVGAPVQVGTSIVYPIDRLIPPPPPPPEG
jgi:uncharacterized surface protein with fasciclin (FAS1) repeats